MARMKNGISSAQAVNRLSAAKCADIIGTSVGTWNNRMNDIGSFRLEELRMFYRSISVDEQGWIIDAVNDFISS